jgi:protoporphyrinogen/coproporphyrinogen III oxidase
VWEPSNASSQDPDLLQISELGLTEDVLPISKQSPAAINKYIYFPDHLVQMPSWRRADGTLKNLSRILTSLTEEPLLVDAVRGLFREFSVKPRPLTLPDESVGDFMSRRFGRAVADNLVSALLHGIYAGDLYQLSMRAVFPQIWYLETCDPKSSITMAMLRNYWRGRLPRCLDDAKVIWRDIYPDNWRGDAASVLLMTDSTVYTLKKGLAQLPEKLAAKLRQNNKVVLRHCNASLTYNTYSKRFTVGDQDEKIGTHGASTDQFDYVIATISPSQLFSALQAPDVSVPPSSPLARLLPRLECATPAVNVMVVNLFYRNPNIVPVRGFGYLIPRSIPLEQNPERALGVIFSSESSHTHESLEKHPDLVQSRANDPNLRPKSQDSVPGTKLTVMLGGHWWNGWSDSDFPDPETGIAMARSVLARHLGIHDDPAIAKARLQRDAIPQYPVGHPARMIELHHDLLAAFDGRLKVAGPGYHGPGINDAVFSACKSAYNIADAANENTGLEAFENDGWWSPQVRV